MINTTYTITPGDKLYGVRVWAQWYFKRIPRFEIFYYIGQDKKKNCYFFDSRTEKSRIIKTATDLKRGDFLPFLIDIETLKRPLTLL